MNVLILHGLGGSDYPHWQAQLAADLLDEAGVNVLFPDLPYRAAPSLQRWLTELHEAMTDFAPDAVVCHSLANLLWFHYLARYPQTRVAAQLLVAPPALQRPLAAAPDFFPVSCPPLAIHAARSAMVLSTDDPYLPPDEARILAGQIDIPVIWIEHGGHINTAAGFGAWPLAKSWVTA